MTSLERFGKKKAGTRAIRAGGALEARKGRQQVAKPGSVRPNEGAEERKQSGIGREGAALWEFRLSRRSA